MAIIGPPRGCAISPMRRPGQPSSLRASLANRSRRLTNLGCPPLQLRERRMTCQFGPLMGSATPPERQPRAYVPTALGANGAGAVTAPNSSFADAALLIVLSADGELIGPEI